MTPKYRQGDQLLHDTGQLYTVTGVSSIVTYKYNLVFKSEASGREIATNGVEEGSAFLNRCTLKEPWFEEGKTYKTRGLLNHTVFVNSVWERDGHRYAAGNYVDNHVVFVAHDSPTNRSHPESSFIQGWVEL